jgi:hypothetical protein
MIEGIFSCLLWMEFAGLVQMVFNQLYVVPRISSNFHLITVVPLPLVGLLRFPTKFAVRQSRLAGAHNFDFVGVKLILSSLLLPSVAVDDEVEEEDEYGSVHLPEDGDDAHAGPLYVLCLV